MKILVYTLAGKPDANERGGDSIYYTGCKVKEKCRKSQQ